MSTMGDALQSWEDASRKVVMQDTWGHLAPEKGVTYRGVITFGPGYGDSAAILHMEFAGLPDSPWLLDAATDFVGRYKTVPYGHVRKCFVTVRNYRFRVLGKSELICIA